MSKKEGISASMCYTFVEGETTHYDPHEKGFFCVKTKKTFIIESYTFFWSAPNSCELLVLGLSVESLSHSYLSSTFSAGANPIKVFSSLQQN